MPLFFCNITSILLDSMLYQVSSCTPIATRCHQSTVPLTAHGRRSSLNLFGVLFTRCSRPRAAAAPAEEEERRRWLEDLTTELRVARRQCLRHSV